MKAIKILIPALLLMFLLVISGDAFAGSVDARNPDMSDVVSDTGNDDAVAACGCKTTFERTKPH